MVHGHSESTGESACRTGILLSQSIFRSREAFASLLGHGRDVVTPALSPVDRTPRQESLAVPAPASFSRVMYSRAEEQESLLI